jgi:uncharacterized protein YqgC (DUF456 family)
MTAAMAIALWVIAVALIVVGIAGTVLPVLPGVALIFAGIALAAWIDGYTRIPVWMVWVVAGLAAIALAGDDLAAVLGARRAGASRLAVAGAAIGVVAGIFAGLIGVVVLPFVGAVIGEFVARRDLRRAGRIGVATWIGLAVGTAVKVAVAFTMVGVFLVALLV